MLAGHSTGVQATACNAAADVQGLPRPVFVSLRICCSSKSQGHAFRASKKAVPEQQHQQQQPHRAATHDQDDLHVAVPDENITINQTYRNLVRIHPSWAHAIRRRQESCN